MSEAARADTEAHIAKVQARMDECVALLIARAVMHDASKRDDAERPGYDALFQALADGLSMAEARTHPLIDAAIVHHLATNDHHPEYHARGIAGMSLLSLLEMACDWKAASERRGKTFELGAQLERFGIEPQLAAILGNTVKELGW